jgi:DNA repair protein SbcD/Mre11
MPLRILHTADWHVGRTIARRSRLAEHRDVLAEIAEKAAAEKVDVVVVAGDLFDQQNPSAEAERVVYDALADLRAAARHVVVIAGNHDSPRRWSALARLADSVHIVAEVSADPADQIVEVDGDDGTRARVVCLPWVAEHQLPDAHETAERLFRPGFAERLRDLSARLVESAGRDLPLIFAAHLHTAEATLGGGERPVSVTPTLALPELALPEGPQYTALGHIHGLQPVGRGGRSFYSGSVLQLDFAERNDDKGLVIAEVGEGAKAPRKVVLERGVRLHRIAGTLGEIEDLAARDALPEGYVEVRITCDGPEAGLGDRVRQVVPDCVAVRLVYPAAETPERSSLKSLSMRDAFARYLVEKAGAPAPDPDLLDRFEALLDDPADDDAIPDTAAA